MASDSDPEWLKSFSPAESRAASPAVSSSSGDSDVPTYQHRAFEDDDDIPFRDLQARAKMAELDTDSSLSELSGSDSDAGSADHAGRSKAGRRDKTAGVVLGNIAPLCMPPAKRLRMDSLLLQVEREGLELAGDIGAVGLFNGEKRSVVLDLKGIQYAGPMVAAHTLCTVQVVEGQAVIREVFQSFAQTQQVSDVLDKEEMVGGNFDEFDDFQISGDEGAEGTDTASAGKQKGKATKGSGGGGKKPATKKPAAKRGAPKKPAPKKTSKNASQKKKR